MKFVKCAGSLAYSLGPAVRQSYLTHSTVLSIHTATNLKHISADWAYDLANAQEEYIKCVQKQKAAALVPRCLFCHFLIHL